MFQRILVALDGSEFSERVLPFVVPIAKAGGAKVQVLSVVDMFGLSTPEHGNGALEPGVVDQITAGAEEYVEGVAARLRSQGLDAEGSTALGGAAATILRTATRSKADLIAIGTHGRSGLGRWVLGSVADRVVHRSKVPVLLVHPSTPPAAEPVTRIVVPVDGSLLAEEALPLAGDLARAFRVAVTLVRSFSPAPVYGGAGAWDVTPQLAEQLRIAEAEAEKAAKDYLDLLTKRVQGQGLNVSAVLKRGEPATRILEQAGDGALIVMTTHGRSGPSRWVLGSVADRVVRQGGRPVVVIPKGAKD